MDILSIFGLVFGLMAVLIGQWLEGGALSSLFQLTAFVIVMGGTLGAMLLQTPWNVFSLGMRMLLWVWWKPVFHTAELHSQVVEWSKIARRDGLLALEPHVARQTDPLISKGLQMVVDGLDAQHIRAALQVDIQGYERLRWPAARMWEQAAGYAPTIGMLGAVLGLVQVMERLGDPAQLGAGIAVAFVSTIYGVGFANLFFFPVANKLKFLVQQQIATYEMVVDGFLLISRGENPHFVQGKLEGYLS
ncbi:flagellar motor protein [Ferrovum sp.]|jgi:chemotaxis protein MotA|uniref:flagellar motor protein n=1 Tax=Ferrovum sp. TaxID=2609467 RepID=UPI00261A5848|nr:flagellar motor protein [Ferrovum sp.]